MAYSQTLDQKRRETLRRQLYGKEVMSKRVTGARLQGPGEKDKSTHSTFSYKNTSESDSSTPYTLNAAPYLTRDLTKILIYASTAVAAQLALFFAVNNHLVKLPI
jgi:hypothetical protein